MINPRLIIHPFQVGLRRQFHQIMKACVVHRQHRQVEALFILARVAVKARTRRHVCLDTENWLDAGFFGSFIKIENAAHRPMISYRCRLHAEFLDLINQIVDLGQTVQHRMKGVIVQVHEIRRLERLLLLSLATHILHLL